MEILAPARFATGGSSPNTPQPPGAFFAGASAGLVAPEVRAG